MLRGEFLCTRHQEFRPRGTVAPRVTIGDFWKSLEFHAGRVYAVDLL
jgi:hypothetical protein